MRLLPAVLLMTGLSTMVVAQPAPQPAPPRGGRTITRAEFIQRATERAATRAAAVFDQVDTSHSGVITGAQLRAWRQQHQGRGGAGGQPGVR